jgi:predicted amidophosphoribosyltransferase
MLRERFGGSCGLCRADDLYAVATCHHQRSPVPPAAKLRASELHPLIDGTYAAAAYRSGWDLDRNHPMSVLMRQEKHRIEESSLRLLGCMLADFVAWHTPLAADVDAVVPVPTSRERVATRGGSIPGGLAAVLSDRLALPLREPLVQTAPHLDHTQARGEERRRGLRNAWRLQRDDALVGRSVLLVDDILTTGTTLRTAAEMLKAAGISRVYAVALMHTERSV